MLPQSACFQVKPTGSSHARLNRNIWLTKLKIYSLLNNITEALYGNVSNTPIHHMNNMYSMYYIWLKIWREKKRTKSSWRQKFGIPIQSVDHLHCCSTKVDWCNGCKNFVMQKNSQFVTSRVNAPAYSMFALLKANELANTLNSLKKFHSACFNFFKHKAKTWPVLIILNKLWFGGWHHHPRVIYFFVGRQLLYYKPRQILFNEPNLTFFI